MNLFKGKENKTFDNSVLGKSKLEKDCKYKQERYSSLAYQKFERETEPFLTTKSSIDIEARVFMFILCLKEEKNKKYSINECDKNIAYLFKSYDELKSYFIKNGVVDINKEILDLCIIKKTKRGTIISLKGLCDHVIKKYKLGKELTQSQIDKIHSKGKITPAEKVKEWESIGLCAPGDAIGSAANRCRAFSNCHECLVEYASYREEYDKMELKPIKMDEVLKNALKGICSIESSFKKSSTGEEIRKIMQLKTSSVAFNEDDKKIREQGPVLTKKKN